MLNCKHATHLMSEALDRPLPLREQLSLKMHLAICQGCRHFGRQLDFLRLASRSLQADDTPPAKD